MAQHSRGCQTSDVNVWVQNEATLAMRWIGERLMVGQTRHNATLRPGTVDRTLMIILRQPGWYQGLPHMQYLSHEAPVQPVPSTCRLTHEHRPQGPPISHEWQLKAVHICEL